MPFSSRLNGGCGLQILVDWLSNSSERKSFGFFYGYYLGLVLILFIFLLGDWILEEGFFLLFFGELMGLID